MFEDYMEKYSGGADVSLKQLEETLDFIDTRTRDDPENGFIESRPLFEKLVADRLHVVALNNLLAQHAEQKTKDGGGVFTSGKFLILASRGDLQLVLGRYSGNPSYIFTSPYEFMQVGASPGRYTVTRYEAPDSWRDTHFDLDARLQRLDSHECDQDSFVFKRIDDVVDFHDFSNLPAIFVRLTRAPRDSFEWAFDRSTLQARSYSTVHLAESNMCGIMDLLSQYGEGDAVPLLAQFVEHPLHFVRWKAVQAVGRLDRGQGLELARRCLEDGHPHVRSAARSTMAAVRPAG